MSLARSGANPFWLVASFIANGVWLLWCWRLWRDGAPFLAGFFFLVGLGWLAATLYFALGWKKFGDVLLQLHGRPSPGGKLSGLVRVPGKVEAAQIDLTLQCKYVRYEQSKAHNNRGVSENTVWTTGGRFPLKRGPGHAECRFEIALAATAPVTSARPLLGGGYGPGHRWELVAHAEVPGVDLLRVFSVVVVEAPSQPVPAPKEGPFEIVRPVRKS